MLVGIDGTGPGDDAKYWRDNRTSFVSQLVRQAGGLTRHAYYLRGPALLGLECARLAQRTVDLVTSRKIGVRSEPVFLAGHSRGGAIAIVAAHLLNARHVTVDAMFLFDAVDRSFVIKGTDRVPPNVRTAYHALRDPEAGSRKLFSNCGLSASLPGQMESKYFFATHAAVGGTPWTGDHPSATNEFNDRVESRVVEQWMWSRLIRHGVVQAM